MKKMSRLRPPDGVYQRLEEGEDRRPRRRHRDHAALVEDIEAVARGPYRLHERDWVARLSQSTGQKGQRHGQGRVQVQREGGRRAIVESVSLWRAQRVQEQHTSVRLEHRTAP